MMTSNDQSSLSGLHDDDAVSGTCIAQLVPDRPRRWAIILHTGNVSMCSKGQGQDISGS